MKCLDFDWQINEFMVYCRRTQLRKNPHHVQQEVVGIHDWSENDC